MRRNLFDNFFVVCVVFVATLLVNNIFSTIFIPIVFGGIVMVSFINALHKKKLYSVVVMIGAFMVIESAQGFLLGSLSLFTFVSYFFIFPFIQKYISLNEIKPFAYIIWFYGALFALMWIFQSVSMDIFIFFMVNIVLEFLILGFML